MYRSPGRATAAAAAAQRFLLFRRRRRRASSSASKNDRTTMRPTTTGLLFHNEKIPLSRVATGVLLSVPVIAILQGAMLLRDYRLKHGKAPRPDMPSRGVVVVEEEETRGPASRAQRWLSMSSQARRRDSSVVPLRLLVVGDSLAAGVGMSKSSTPALPESIAQALSKALGGRAVYWTCFGTPGVSATEVVQQIHQLDDIPTPLTQRVAEWQAEQKMIAQEKLETAKMIAQEWWEQHKEPIDTDDELQETKKNNPIVRWWKRKTARVRKDVQSFRKILAKNRSDLQLEQKKVTKLVHRKSLDPDFVAQYDIAVVLTGLNDLKDTFLPFMMSRQRKEMIDESKKDNNGSGLKGELIRIIHALNKKMKISIREDIASSGKDEVDSGDENRPASPKAKKKGGNRTTRMPLVVFPALPIAPIQMLQVVPLSWFIGPLIRRSDRNKQLIAEMYPDLVVYVEAPNSKVFSDAEAQRGPLWEDFQKERVLLKLTDIAQNVRERVEHLMHQYERTWALDAEEEENDLYELDVDGVELLSDYSTSHPGASMVSADGIHPNDLGYQVFGRLIAQAIIEHWQRSGPYRMVERTSSGPSY